MVAEISRPPGRLLLTSICNGIAMSRIGRPLRLPRSPANTRADTHLRRVDHFRGADGRGPLVREPGKKRRSRSSSHRRCNACKN